MASRGKEIMKRLILIVAAVAILIIPTFAGATTVLDETASFKVPGDIATYTFTADQTPLTYLVTLTDYDFRHPFDELEVLIAHSGSPDLLLTQPGSGSFTAALGTKYSASVSGMISEVPGGTFNLLIKAVPIPGGITLLISGLFGVLLLRRRNR